MKVLNDDTILAERVQEIYSSFGEAGVCRPNHTKLMIKRSLQNVPDRIASCYNLLKNASNDIICMFWV